MLDYGHREAKYVEERWEVLHQKQSGNQYKPVVQAIADSLLNLIRQDRR